MSLLATPRIVLLLAAIHGCFSISCDGKHDWAPLQQDIYRQANMNDDMGQYQRNYIVRLPAGYDGHWKVPVLFWFHWYTGPWPYSIESVVQVADEHGFILVSPEGMHDGFGDGMRSWNLGSGGRDDVCSAEGVWELEYASCQQLGLQGRCNCYTCYDDVGFVAQVFRDVADSLCIDEEQVYAFATSEGAAFLYTLIGSLATRGLLPHFRAVIPFMGGIQNNQLEEFAVAGTAVFAHHGKWDVRIPIDGGASDDGWLWTPLETILLRFAQENGCGGDWARLETGFSWAQGFDGCWQIQGCEVPLVRCIYNVGHDVFFPEYSAQMMWSHIQMFQEQAKTQEEDPATGDKEAKLAKEEIQAADVEGSSPEADEKLCGHSASDCLPKYKDPAIPYAFFSKHCLSGGIGCGALGQRCCRFCGFGDYLTIKCPESKAAELAILDAFAPGTDQTSETYGWGRHNVGWCFFPLVLLLSVLIWGSVAAARHRSTVHESRALLVAGTEQEFAI